MIELLRYYLLKIRVFIVIFFLGAFVTAEAQDPQFSQFYVASMYLNPAMAGQDGDMYLSTNYRSQWSSISAPYTTTQVTGSLPFVSKTIIDRNYGGIAASFYNDQAGNAVLKTTGFSVSGAYNLPLDVRRAHVISFGLQAGMVQKSVDLGSAQWGSQYIPGSGYDPNAPADASSISSNRLFPTINAGLIWYFGNREFEYSKIRSYLGASVYNINSPNESFVSSTVSKLPRLYRVHGGIDFHTTSKLNISPNLLFAYQAGQAQLNAGLYASYLLVDKAAGPFAHARFILGGWYRLGDAAIASVGFSAKWYQVGFSYDFNASKLRSYNTTKPSAIELSLVLRKPSNISLKRYSTPRI